MMNDFRTYQSIIDEIDKITSCIKISASPNAIYGSDDFHDMVVRAVASNSYISGSASAMQRTAASDCGPMGAARRIPTDEWYRDILSKMDDGKVVACIENTISSQIDRLCKIGRIPADGMTLAIDAHWIPYHCKDHGSEMIHSRDLICYYFPSLSALFFRPIFVRLPVLPTTTAFGLPARRRHR